MTIKLFDNDSYLTQCHAKIVDIKENSIIFDQTIFYAQSGGQPGDKGVMHVANYEFDIINTFYDEDNLNILHEVKDATLCKVGDIVELKLDWKNRYRLMMMHSSLHVLCGIIDAPVMGGGMSYDSSRLDFDLPEPLDKNDVQQKLDEIFNADYAISGYTLNSDEMEQGLDKVRTVGVKPKAGVEGLRMVKIANGEHILDEQPCGGTHVKRTSELKGVYVKKIEKKNKDSRRIRLAFKD